MHTTRHASARVKHAHLHSVVHITTIDFGALGGDGKSVAQISFG